MRGYSQRKLVLGFGRPWTTVEEGAGAVERPVLAAEFAGVTAECFEGQRRRGPRLRPTTRRRGSGCGR
jgi:hypothetical protein